VVFKILGNICCSGVAEMIYQGILHLLGCKCDDANCSYNAWKFWRRLPRFGLFGYLVAHLCTFLLNYCFHFIPSGVRKQSIDNEFYPGNAFSVNLMLKLHDGLLFQNSILFVCQVTPNLSWCGGGHDAQQTQSSSWLA